MSATLRAPPAKAPVSTEITPSAATGTETMRWPRTTQIVSAPAAPEIWAAPSQRLAALLGHRPPGIRAGVGHCDIAADHEPRQAMQPEFQLRPERDAQTDTHG